MKTYLTFSLAALCCGFAAVAAQGQIYNQSGFELADPSQSHGTALSGIDAIYGSYDGGNVGFAGWEKFSSPTFNSMSPQYWAGGVGLSVKLAQTNRDAWLSDSDATSNTGLINVDGTDYYGRLTMGGYDFTIEGIATAAISSITLQIKHSRFFDTVTGELLTPFVAGLNVGGEVLTADGVIGPQLPNFSDSLRMSTYSEVYTYRWDNLNIAANEVFSIGFSAPADVSGEGFSVDTIAMQVQQVPEPAVLAAVLAFAALAMVARRRRVLTK